MYRDNKDTDIVVVRWNDNSVVVLLSYEFVLYPVTTYKRYSVIEKAKTHIPQPNVVKNYNIFTGDVDQLDNHVSNYRISFRGK